MNRTFLLRSTAAAAIFAGALRVIASFIPYEEGSASLEILYLVIDVGLIFGLMGFYIVDYEVSGVAGLTGFVLAFTGTALIVGPDGTLGPVDIYQAGSLLITLGLLIWAIGAWRTSRLPMLARTLWIASALLGVGGAILNFGGITFILAGLAFGASFMIAGFGLWRMAADSTSS